VDLRDRSGDRSRSALAAALDPDIHLVHNKRRAVVASRMNIEENDSPPVERP
jgi:hypothetical protein